MAFLMYLQPFSTKNVRFPFSVFLFCSATDRPIDARNNWWGSELRSYINGKIWDNLDDPNLLSIDFWQPRLDNRSVVEGKVNLYCCFLFFFSIIH